MAEILIHPRLKTERGKSPCPKTNSCRKDTAGKNRVPPAEGPKVKAGKAKPLGVGQSPNTAAAMHPIPQRSNGQQDGEAATPWTAGTKGGKQGLPKGKWLAPRI